MLSKKKLKSNFPQNLSWEDLLGNVNLPEDTLQKNRDVVLFEDQTFEDLKKKT